MLTKSAKGIYVISNINPSRHSYIDEVCSHFGDGFRIFKPHTDNKYNADNSKIEYGAFFTDKVEMNKADVSLVLMPLFGRDCSSEIGYSHGIGNCVIAYANRMETEQERDWLNDWMVKGFLDYIITDNQQAFQLLGSNPLLRQKEQSTQITINHKIKSLGELPEIVQKLLAEKINSQNLLMRLDKKVRKAYYSSLHT